MSDPKTVRQIPQLTSIRFFAAMIVVLFHGWIYFLPGKQAPNIVAIGYIGVSMFFVLSGYILAYVYLDSDRPRLDTRRFLVARFARVYPLYAASLLFELPLYLHYLFSENNLSTAIFKLFVVSGAYVTMLQAWVPRLLRWNFPSWSLSAEAFFYLMFPLIAVALWRLSPKRLTVAAVLAFAAALLIPIAGIWLYPQHFLVRDTSPYENYLKLNPLLHLPSFIAGILLAAAQRNFREAWPAATLERRAAVIKWIGFIGLVVVIMARPAIPYLLLNNGLLIPIFGCLIFGLANSRGWAERALSVPWMVLLGEASYAIYLLHVPLIRWFTFAAPGSRSVTAMLIFIAILIVLSILSYKYLEMPLRRSIQQRFQVPRSSSRGTGSA